MKKLLFIVFCFNFLLAKQAFTQIDTTLKIDILKAPSSPASNLLGISNSDIEKPSDVTAFMTSLRTATNNFTVIPKSFAVDFAPYKIFGKQNLDPNVKNDKSKNGFKESAVISFAFNKVEKNDSSILSTGKTQLGIGFKFSLIKADISKKAEKVLTNIYKLQVSDEEIINEIYNEDAALNILNRETIIDSNNLIIQKNKFSLLNTDDSLTKTILENINKRNLIINQRKTELKNNKFYRELKYTQYNTKIKEEASKVDLERKGFSLDFAAGTVIDFMDNKFDNSYVTKAGAWFTACHTSKNTPTSFLGYLRYLYNPKTTFADPNLRLENLHTLDFGGRFITTPMDNKLLLSAEFIYRSILNTANATSSWRVIFNVEYVVGTNQRLTFNFGRNFDGETYKGGNIVSALNFLIGFGQQKVSNKN
jgi:hypothetical protein